MIGSAGLVAATFVPNPVTSAIACFVVGLGLAIALGGVPLMFGWGGALGSPPVMAVATLAAGVLCVLALAWLRRPRPRPAPEAHAA